MSTLNSFKKRGKRKSANPLVSFKKKLQEEGLTEGQQIIFHPSGEEKMSEVLFEFIEPYAEYADTDEEYRKLLVIAILAWNAALLPEKKREEMVSNLLGEMNLLETREFQSIIELLVERKLKYFSGNRRLIVNYELTDLGGKRHLSVASTPSVDEERDFHHAAT